LVSGIFRSGFIFVGKDRTKATSKNRQEKEQGENNQDTFCSHATSFFEGMKK